MVRLIIVTSLVLFTAAELCLSRSQTAQTTSSLIALSWEKDMQGDKTGYLLSKKEGNGGWVVMTPTLSWSSVCGSSSQCSYSGSAVSNLTPGTQYCFRLQAADDYTNIDPQNTFSEDYGDFTEPMCKIAPLPVPKDSPNGR
ncbi:MAG TPA: fibronectin type III domain-containing protein [Terriglobia bacterium]|nr:fibronectin type III domain-containing protein [Terriglobia bacterium]